MPVDTKFYDTLKVLPTASQVDIKKAYRNQAKVCHPDKGGDAEKMQKLNNAYEVLSDESKKQLYDKYGEKGLQDGASTGFDDIFSRIFTGGGFRFGQQRPQPQVPDNINHVYNVTLEQLCSNATVKLKYTVSLICKFSSVGNCNICNGTGNVMRVRQLGRGMIQQIRQVCSECKGLGKILSNCSKCTGGFVKEKKIVELHLTEKLPNKHKFRFYREGNQIINKAIGDFIVVLNYVKHPMFTVQNSNLLIHRTISLTEALTGYKEDITHPSSRIINIDTTGEIINPYDDYIVKKMGMTTSHNLHIKFKIVFPTKLDEFNLN
jgi:DnaJ-class molecular chaperone